MNVRTTGETLQCQDGVILRPPQVSDAEALAIHANSRDIWINLRDQFPYPYSLGDASDWIASVRDQSPRVSFIIDFGGQAIGGIGLVLGEDIQRCSAEVGYWLGTEYWGRGIATSALDRICQYAFERLALLRVFAVPLVWNSRSLRVLEKAGFRQEGIMERACIKDGKVVDMALYAKLSAT